MNSPNPGTPGTDCRCPHMDNGYGRNRPADFRYWVINLECSVHGPDKIRELEGQ